MSSSSLSSLSVGKEGIGMDKGEEGVSQVGVELMDGIVRPE